MPRTTSQEFKDAAAASKQFTKLPSDDDLLAIYCLFKQATQDPPFEKAPAPGTFDFRGKAKKNAWRKLVEQGVTPEEAEEKYIALVEEMKTKYEYDPNKAPVKVNS